MKRHQYPSRRGKKRRSPLQCLWTAVKAESLANGTVHVIPVEPWVGMTVWNERDGGGPGIFTRARAAHRLEKLINAHLKGKR